MGYILEGFSIPEMLRCGRELREATLGATRMENAAEAIVRHFYEQFESVRDGKKACVLVRFYKTHRYERLEPELQRFADHLLADKPHESLRCLTLLASAGVEPDWCDRRRSRGHQVIPLVSAEMVEQAPMIAQLIKGLGLDVQEVVKPGVAIMRSQKGKSFSVLHVEEALGSRFIPAQTDFVVPYGVRSVVGFGGELRSGELFTVIIFSRVPISEDVAERFRHIALDAKYALFRIDEDRVFAERLPLSLPKRLARLDAPASSLADLPVPPA